MPSLLFIRTFTGSCTAGSIANFITDCCFRRNFRMRNSVKVRSGISQEAAIPYIPPDFLWELGCKLYFR